MTVAMVFLHTACVIAAPADGLQAYWEKFRTAAGAHDLKALAALTQFPFETRGVDDSDPAVKHTRAAFPALILRLLAQKTGSVGRDETHAQLIARTAKVTPADGTASLRVGDFVFYRIKGEWRFVRAYLDE